MVIKKLLKPLALIACLPTLAWAIPYPLPGNECTSLTAMLDMGPGTGCKITATQQDTNSVADYGYIHARLYPYPGAVITNDPNQASLDKLIIFVDGFSPADAFFSQYPNFNTAYEPFEGFPDISTDDLTPDGLGLLDVVNSTEKANLLSVKLQVHNQDSLQDNAYAIEQLISFISQYRNSSRKIVIVGYSLGGVAVRYALADMEKNGIDHKANLYISYDAPHQGAFVPQSLQYVIPLIESYAPDFNGWADTITANNKLKVAADSLRAVANQGNAIVQQYRQQYTLGISNKTLTSTIGDQFVMDNINSPGVQTNFINQLRSNGVPGSNGYPVVLGLKKIAIVNGSTQNKPLPPIFKDTVNNAYFNFKGVKGQVEPVTLAEPLKGYAEVNLNLFPTAPNAVAATSKVKLYANWTYLGRCYIFFTCTFYGEAAANFHREKVAASTVKAWDSVPGGYVDVGVYLLNATRALEESGIFSYSPVYTQESSKFSFIPTISALDATSTNPNAPFVKADTPFDAIYSNGDAISAGNQQHGVKSLELYAYIDEIKNALFTLAPPATVNTVFSVAPVSASGKMTGNYGVISLNLCAAITKAPTSVDQAMQQLNLASNKAGILYSQGKITVVERDDLLSWIELLKEQLILDPIQFAYDLNTALSNTSLSCN